MRLLLSLDWGRVQLSADYEPGWLPWRPRWDIGSGVGHWALVVGMLGGSIRYQWRRV